MRQLMGYLSRLLILIGGLALGMGCNALPNPMPAFDLGSKGSGDAAVSPSQDAPQSVDKDLGIVDIPSSGIDSGAHGDASSDGVQDGLKLIDSGADGLMLDGEVDGTTDALTSSKDFLAGDN